MINFDFERPRRMGFEETVLAEGKALEDLITILASARDRHQSLLMTRVAIEDFQALSQAFPDLEQEYVYNSHARTLRSRRQAQLFGRGEFQAAIVTAGTSDRAVAEEASETLKHYQIKHHIYPDVGVSGLHRLLAIQDKLRLVECIICVAGMDGALASVVGGLCPAPVIAVPTSTGYGASDQGKAALASMLASCSNGLCVMNIDNGFGAAMAVVRFRNLLTSKREDDCGRKVSD